MNVSQPAVQDRLEANKQLVRDFMDATSRGDVDAIISAYTPDGYVETMGRTLISGRFGVDHIRMAAGRIFEAFPEGISFTILNMTAEDDRVAVEAKSRGAHISGRLYENHYHFLYRLRDGKIASLQEFMDTELVTDILCGGQRPAEK